MTEDEIDQEAAVQGTDLTLAALRQKGTGLAHTALMKSSILEQGAAHQDEMENLTVDLEVGQHHMTGQKMSDLKADLRAEV